MQSLAIEGTSGCSFSAPASMLLAALHSFFVSVKIMVNTFILLLF
jgi:hypothetical protein